jgi:hypothetical protein
MQNSDRFTTIGSRASWGKMIDPEVVVKPGVPVPNGESFQQKEV